MPRLIWSPSATRDVQRLYRFLSARNPDAAKRAVGAIRAGVRLLARHPQSGRPVELMEAEFRERVIEFGDGGYIALYRFDGEMVVLLAVRHGREAGY
jgi:plasmid stabilization system protein ParE